MGLSDMMLPDRVQMGRPDPNQISPEDASVDTSPERLVMPWEVKDLSKFTEFTPGKAAGLIRDAIMGPSQPEQELLPTFAGLQEEFSHPDSKTLIKAIDNGHANKAFDNPITTIREGVKLGNTEHVEKGFSKLAELLSKTDDMGPLDKFMDIYFNRGEISGRRERAHKIASDVVLNELLRPGSTNSNNEIEDAVRMGLIHPSELRPEQRPQETFANLIPQEPFAMGADGLPVSSVQQSLIPAQPDQIPSGMAFPSGYSLSPIQTNVTETRLEAAKKGRQEHPTPEGIQLFDRHMEAQRNAHIAKYGTLPTPEDENRFVSVARGFTEKEPIAGGLKEAELSTNIAKSKADTARTIEQTATEIAMRPENLKETKAKTAELLSKMNLNITEASRAITRGLYAEYEAKLQAARAGMSELKSQIQIVSAVLADKDLTKDDKLKYDQYLLDMIKSGFELAKRGGPFGLEFLDMGKPNVNLLQTGPTGSRVPTAPELGPDGLTILPPANTGVDPTVFAPQAPAGVASLQPQASSDELTPEQKAAFLTLREHGISKEEAKKRVLKKAK
jgi:hypothetical protein